MNTKQKINLLTKRISRNPLDFDALEERGMLYLQERQYLSAKSDFLKIVTEKEKNFKLVFFLLVCAAIEGDHAKVQEYNKDLENFRPAVSEDYSYWVTYYLKIKNDPHAILAILNQAIKKNPGQAELYHLRAQVYDHKGHFGRAKNDYKKAFDLDRNSSEYLSELADLQIKVWNSEDAIGTLSVALGLDSQNAVNFYKRAELRLERKMLPEALDDIEKATQIDPHNLEYVCFKAKLYARMGKANQAKNLFKKLVQDEAYCTIDFLLEAKELSGANLVPFAIETLAARWDDKKGDVEYLITMAQLYCCDLKTEQGLKYASETVKLAPRDVDCATVLAVCLFLSKLFSKCLQAMEHIRNNAQAQVTYSGLSPFLRLFHLLHKRSIFLTSLENSFNTTAEMHVYSRCLFYFNEVETALIYCNKTLAKDDSKPEYFYTRAMIYLHLDQYDQALEDLHRCVKLDRKESAYYLPIAWCHAQRINYGKCLEALKLASKSTTKGNDRINREARSFIKIMKQLFAIFDEKRQVLVQEIFDCQDIVRLTYPKAINDIAELDRQFYQLSDNHDYRQKHGNYSLRLLNIKDALTDFDDAIALSSSDNILYYQKARALFIQNRLNQDLINEFDQLIKSSTSIEKPVLGRLINT